MKLNRHILKLLLDLDDTAAKTLDPGEDNDDEVDTSLVLTHPTWTAHATWGKNGSPVIEIKERS